MKFGHDFTQSLENGQFPQEWIDSAVSYKRLKKCIKKVQKQLQALELDAQTAGQHSGSPSRNEVISEVQHSGITPKFVVAMDPITGTPRDAWLTPETLEAFRGAASSRAESSLPPLSEISLPPPKMDIDEGSPSLISSVVTSESEDTANEADEQEKLVALREFEIPLITDSEFFRELRKEIDRLDELHSAQQRIVEAEVSKLGRELASMVKAGTKKSKNDLLSWREIFRVYVEAEVFFSSGERDHGARDYDKAATKLRDFDSSIKQEPHFEKMTKEGQGAFERFLQINQTLLQYLQFQELNRTALRKIMKKFGKRTALQAEAILPVELSTRPFSAESLARSIYFKISEDLLTLIPQFNDYLCPVCFNISFKPIRLKCGHVFCIRCLVVMQRAQQDHCPLCRGASVMEASSENLDMELMTFLKTNFPREVKMKQKENERAAGIDRYGEDFDKVKCNVM